MGQRCPQDSLKDPLWTILAYFGIHFETLLVAPGVVWGHSREQISCMKLCSPVAKNRPHGPFLPHLLEGRPVGDTSADSPASNPCTHLASISPHTKGHRVVSVSLVSYSSHFYIHPPSPSVCRLCFLNQISRSNAQRVPEFPSPHHLQVMPQKISEMTKGGCFPQGIDILL